MALTAFADDEISDHNARRLIAFGVTTIRNPAGDLPAAARYKARRAAGEVIGPESFDAGRVLNDQAMAGLASAVPDAATMHRLVAAQVEAGADWIKLYTGLSPELLVAGIEAAHAHGRPAVAHLDKIAWPEALAMGLDGLVHLMPTNPDLLEPEARAAWQADARPGAFEFFEWWEHFDPDGPGGDRLVAAFEAHRPATSTAYRPTCTSESREGFCPRSLPACVACRPEEKLRHVVNPAPCKVFPRVAFLPSGDLPNANHSLADKPERSWRNPRGCQAPTCRVLGPREPDASP